MLQSLRSLTKHPLLPLLNIITLSIGLTACIVTFLLINYETSFDTFSPERSRIYRIYSNFSGSYTALNKGVPTAFADKVRESFTGIDAVANFHTWTQNVKVRDNQGERLLEDQKSTIIITHPDYFKVFNYYEWLAGDKAQSLTAPNQVVLTESTAKKYFPNISPDKLIGRELIYADSLSVSVSGIVKDINGKTDLNFTDFISFSTIENNWLKNMITLNDWTNVSSASQLFVKTTPGVSREQLDRQMKIIGDQYALMNKDESSKNTPTLQSLSELHFDPDLGIFDDSRAVMKKSTMMTLGIIALMLLLLASSNFVNLETAQASRRAKEVGVRKILGSSRVRLVRQFLFESFTLTLLAIMLSLGLSVLVIRMFADLFPPDLSIDFTDYRIILFLITSLIVVSGMAGLYPALVLSATSPMHALKNMVKFRTSTRSSNSSTFVRKSLTVFQFAVAQILIIASLAVGMQINYMLNKDLGFSTDKIISVTMPSPRRPELRQALKTELDKITDVDATAMQQAAPTSISKWERTFDYNNGKEIVKHSVTVKYADSSYLSLYNIKLLAGRNLRTTDTIAEYLINETYMKMLGFKDPNDALGKIIKDRPIVGVVRDFHSRSLHTAIEPIAMMCDPRRMNSIGIRVKGAGLNNMQPTLEKIETAWKKVYGDEKFEYTFVDDVVRSYYETELRTGRLAKSATGIAVLISCLGLFALSSFTVVQRTKEIGVRRVLGASVNSLIVLLSKDFILLVVIAFVVSGPIAYYVAYHWLQEFAYRIDVGVWVFLIAGLSSIVTALIAISFKTLKAASEDPIKALRYE